MAHWQKDPDALNRQCSYILKEKMHLIYMYPTNNNIKSIYEYFILFWFSKLVIESSTVFETIGYLEYLIGIKY